MSFDTPVVIEHNGATEKFPLSSCIPIGDEEFARQMMDKT
jgi:hypothetical protein